MDKSRKGLRVVFFNDFLKFGLIVIVVGLMLLILHNTTKNIDNQKKATNTYIGEKVNIGNDTLIVTNYNFWYDTFELSDGCKVSPKLVKDNLIKQKK